MARQETLTETVTNFMRIHREWVASTEQLLTQVYEDALTDTVSAFAQGDIPGELRAVAVLVAKLSESWERYQSYVTQAQPMPRNEFWSVVSELEKEIHGRVAPQIRTIEPVWLLLQQGVSTRQVASEIYGYNGVGPFMLNGVPQEHLVLKEAKNEGSVIPANWVHPMHVARQAEIDRIEAGHLRRLSDKLHTEPMAPEPLDDLIQQHVFPDQIAKMKHITIDAVIDRAREMGIELKTREAQSAERGAFDRPLTPRDDGVLGGLTEADNAAVESEPEADDENTTEQLIFEAADSGQSTQQIAKALEMKASEVARVLRNRVKDAEAVEA